MRKFIRFNKKEEVVKSNHSDSIKMAVLAVLVLSVGAGTIHLTKEGITHQAKVNMLHEKGAEEFGRKEQSFDLGFEALAMQLKFNDKMKERSVEYNVDDNSIDIVIPSIKDESKKSLYMVEDDEDYCYLIFNKEVGITDSNIFWAFKFTEEDNYHDICEFTADKINDYVHDVEDGII